MTHCDSYGTSSMVALQASHALAPGPWHAVHGLVHAMQVRLSIVSK